MVDYGIKLIWMEKSLGLGTVANDEGPGVIAMRTECMARTTQFSRDAILLVLSSDHADPDDYVRDYEEYLAILQLADK